MELRNPDVIYKDLLKEILTGEESFSYEDTKRDNVVCHQLNSKQIKFDLRQTFPLLQTKNVSFKNIVTELLWFLKGHNNIKYLVENGCNIWNKDAYNYMKLLANGYNEDSLPKDLKEFKQRVLDLETNGFSDSFEDPGFVGAIYGTQWRHYQGVTYTDGGEHEIVVDQIASVFNGVRQVPMSRRHIVTAWNPVYANNPDQCALPPCHWSFEILPFVKSKVGEKVEYGFDLKWHQRSVDTFLGLPYNIASYATLMKIVEKFTGFEPRFLIGDLSNVHIYDPHMDAVKEQLSQLVKVHDVKLTIDFPTENFDIKTITKHLAFEHFKLEGYNPSPSIKAEMLAITNQDWNK